MWQTAEDPRTPGVLRWLMLLCNLKIHSSGPLKQDSEQLKPTVARAFSRNEFWRLRIIPDDVDESPLVDCSKIGTHQRRNESFRDNEMTRGISILFNALIWHFWLEQHATAMFTAIYRKMKASKATTKI